MITRAAAIASLLIAARIAHADAPAPAPAAEVEPDPAVVDAASANLEPTGRHGIVVSGALMPSEFVGFGSRSDTGLSASVSLRLGKVASSTTTMYIELEGAALVHQPVGQPTTATNSLAAALVGALHYVAPSLWLRFGLGVGSYSRDEELVDGMLVAHERLGGAISNVGVGLDLVKWRYAALGVEASSSLLIHRDGWTTMSGLGVGLTF